MQALAFGLFRYYGPFAGMIVLGVYSVAGLFLGGSPWLTTLVTVAGCERFLSDVWQYYAGFRKQPARFTGSRSQIQNRVYIPCLVNVGVTIVTQGGQLVGKSGTCACSIELSQCLVSPCVRTRCPGASSIRKRLRGCFLLGVYNYNLALHQQEWLLEPQRADALNVNQNNPYEKRRGGCTSNLGCSFYDVT